MLSQGMTVRVALGLVDGELDSKHAVPLVRFGLHDMGCKIVILAICNEV